MKPENQNQPSPQPSSIRNRRVFVRVEIREDLLPISYAVNITECVDGNGMATLIAAYIHAPSEPSNAAQIMETFNTNYEQGVYK